MPENPTRVIRFCAARIRGALSSLRRRLVLVTFNGSRFDLPIIQRYFRNFSAPWVHIDLRTVLMRLGHRAGLKTIEQRLGIIVPRIYRE